MKNNVYKLYIGEYRKKGLPPLTFLKNCDDKNLNVEINNLLDRITYGKDLYIKRCNDDFTAGWYSYFKNSKEILHEKM